MSRQPNGYYSRQVDPRQTYASGQWSEDQQWDPRYLAALQAQQDAHDSAMYYQQQQQMGTAAPQFDQPYAHQSGYDDEADLGYSLGPKAFYANEEGEAGSTDDWRQRAAAPKRGQTKKVKLVRGHVSKSLERLATFP